MSPKSETPSNLQLPEFVPGKIIYESPNHYYRVVTDFKPRTNHEEKDQRFFIEPLTDDAELMLRSAALKHNIVEDQFNLRPIPNGTKRTKFRLCLRADFIADSLPSLLAGTVEIPKAGEDTMPSPLRMEQCLLTHPQGYSFKD